MARHIHLVRHGEAHNPDEVVYDSLPGYPLSDIGTAQARSASRFLGSQPIVAVWSSPLQRALETAAPIAKRCGLAVLVDEALIEWSLLSRWAGTPWADLPTVRPGELEAYLAHPSELDFSEESLEALAMRMVGAIRRIDTRNDAGDVVIVGHQDPIQAARLALTGRDLSTLHTDKPTHASVITLTPGTPWREVAMWEPEAV
jgi:broad specificity phosphatase PhoE